MWFCLEDLRRSIPIFLILCSGLVPVFGDFPGLDDCNDLNCLNGGLCVMYGSKPVCNCSTGYTGRRCEHRDPCATNPCHSHGRCISNNLGQFHCDCESGWIGTDCTEDLDECHMDGLPPCAHAGICTNTPGSFVCQCPVGFAGPMCQDVVLQCLAQPCRNGGRCVEEPGKYRCECAPGYTGHNCELEINECSGSPCEPNGQCEDLIGAYRCNCFPGWTGRHCEIRILTCMDWPCQNNATCEDIPFPQSVNRTHAFRCHCNQGFTGELCETHVPDPCGGITCLNGATCEDGKCLCPAGFVGQFCDREAPGTTELTIFWTTTLAGDSVETTACLNSTEPFENTTDSSLHCSIGTCLNGGQCTNRTHCLCPRGYKGTRCEISPCFDNPCLNGGACVYDVSSLDGIACRCAENFIGDRCELKLPACSAKPCDPYGRCVEQISGYTCECLDGVDGPHCNGNNGAHFELPDTKNQDNFNATKVDSCPVGTCANGARCVALVRSQPTRPEDSPSPGSDRICQCDTAIGRFDGPRCDNDVDECVVGVPEGANSSACLNGGQCVNTYGSYFCRCPPGWSGPRCASKYQACSNGSVCRNGGTCVEHDIGFQCICRAGFTGALCETEIDECASEPCQNGGKCFDLIGSFLCLCPSGWTGRNCERTVGTNSLQPEMECNLDGICGSEDDDPSDYVRFQDCLNGGIWQQRINDTQRGRCQCPLGYLGPRCEGQINLCRLDSRPVWSKLFDEQSQLLRWVDQTIPAHGSPDLRMHWLQSLAAALHQSHWPPDSVLLKQGSDTQSGLCNPEGTSECVPQLGNFTCLCRANYHGALCEQSRDLCRETEMELGEAYCHNGGLCETQIIVNPETGTSRETVMCRCRDGYGGSRCQLFTDVCFPNPCLHGGLCQMIPYLSTFSSTLATEVSHNSTIRSHRTSTAATVAVAVVAESTATVTRGGPSYQCICPSDRAGRHCEVDRHTACLPDSDPLWCGQQARCIAGPEGSKCNCPAGFCGPHCEHSGTTCAPLRQPESAFASWLGPILEQNTCEWNQCATKRGNGRCDHECDRFACEFDGLECALTITDPLDALDEPRAGTDHPIEEIESNRSEAYSPKPSLPWSNCSVIRRDGIPCHLRFADDRCDPACATEACLFDGWDCETSFQLPSTSSSPSVTEAPEFADRAQISTNTICPDGCNVTASSGSVCKETECLTQSISTVLSGDLVLLVRISPAKLLEPSWHGSVRLNQLLSGLSGLLHLNVSMKRLAGGLDQWMIYPVSLTRVKNTQYSVDLGVQSPNRTVEQKTASRRRTIRSPRAAMNEFKRVQTGDTLIGSQIYLQLDATSCAVQGRSCFQHVDRAAQFITAAMHHRHYSFLHPVLSVQSTPGTRRGTTVVPGRRRLWQPFDWLWSLNWPIYAVLAISGMLILMILIGVMFTASQLSQRSACQSAAHRRSLSAYLHAIGKKRNAKKVQRAKIWFPEHGLLDRTRTMSKPVAGSSATHGPLPSSRHRHHQQSSLRYAQPPSQCPAGDSDRLSLMWYLSGEVSEYKPMVYMSDTNSPTIKRARTSQVSTFLSPSSASSSTSSSTVTITDVSHVNLAGNAFGVGSMVGPSHTVPVTQVIKPEDQTDPQSGSIFHTQYLTKNYQHGLSEAAIGDTSSSGPPAACGSGTGGVCCEVGNAGGITSTTSTSTTTTNTVSTRVDTTGSGQDTLNTLQWDRSSLGPVAETWSFYQIILRLLHSNGLEDLAMHRCCDSTEAEGTSLVRSVLQYTASLDRQDHQAGALSQTSVDKPINPVTSTHICAELHSTCPILFPRLYRLLDFRLAETGETLLHAAARLNQASSCAVLLDAGADPTSVDNAGRTALLSAVSSGALDAIHVILSHSSVNSNPMCFVPSFLTDSTTPLMQAIKLGDADAFRMILHAMNIQICTIAKAHTTTSAHITGAGAAPLPSPSQQTSVYPPGTQSSSHPVEPLSLTHAWSISQTCHSKDLVVVRSVAPDPGITAINEDNAMSLLDLNMTDNLGRTALHWAAVTDQPDMLGCLLEAGASLDVQTTCDETPLALAAREGAFSACRLLLVAGANPELADYLDRTPKQLAQAAGHGEIVRLFEASAHPDSVMLLNPGSSRQVGFPQGSSTTWSHRTYPSRTRLIADNQETFDSSLFFSSHSAAEESSRCEAGQNIADRINSVPGISTDSAIWEIPKKYQGTDRPFLMTDNNRYTTMVNSDFSSMNFFELESLRSQLTVPKPLQCDSGPLSPSRDHAFYAYSQTALFDSNDVDQAPMSNYPHPDSNHFETGISGPVPGETHITSSDSESPNYWSSSPSDSSPKHQYRQRCVSKTITPGVRQADHLSSMISFSINNMKSLLPSRSYTLSANRENGEAMTRTEHC
ncbi:hypothetical protein FGIG_02108 [Fasciola gigantica]|uniref:EGF-like domain-containing protein n=1 Tax=Fasciola gigantica TaxID=46835 RepID=A0A504YLH3_FASGI|nr:hypothetical protein FGIG_02108 [Fasciola gigantica]